MLFLFSSVLLLLPLPTSTLVALGEPQLAHNVICRVVYLANNKNRTGSQWLEANLRESEEYKTPIGRPVASGRTLSDRTSGAGSPSDRAPCPRGKATRSNPHGHVPGHGTQRRRPTRSQGKVPHSGCIRTVFMLRRIDPDARCAITLTTVLLHASSQEVASST